MRQILVIAAISALGAARTKPRTADNGSAFPGMTKARIAGNGLALEESVASLRALRPWRQLLDGNAVVPKSAIAGATTATYAHAMERIGLRLEGKKEAVDTIPIAHAERPSEH